MITKLLYEKGTCSVEIRVLIKIRGSFFGLFSNIGQNLIKKSENELNFPFVKFQDKKFLNNLEILSLAMALSFSEQFKLILERSV